MKAGGPCFSKTKCSSPHIKSERYTVSDIAQKKQTNDNASLPTGFSSKPQIKKIGEYTYDTGRFITQNGKHFPIIFTLEVTKHHSIDIKIPIPDKYKKTILSNKVPHFGRIIITPKDSYLNAFYIYPQVLSKDATRYEKEAFRGIGKEILCFAIEEYMKGDIIKLSAEGQQCENEIGVYPYPYEKIKNHLEKYYKDNRDIMYYINKENLKILRWSFCTIEKQKKLVKYYSKYGFKIVNYDEKDNKIVLDITDDNIYKNIELGRIGNIDNIYVATKMEAKVSDILKFCKKI